LGNEANKPQVSLGVGGTRFACDRATPQGRIAPSAIGDDTSQYPSHNVGAVLINGALWLEARLVNHLAKAIANFNDAVGFDVVASGG